MKVEYMKAAINEALKCQDSGDVPVGCVIVKDGQIIASGHNTKERDNMATSHGEINAINMACKVLKTSNLKGCSLYVTLEPCPMCAGAIVNARIDNLYFGAYDKKGGAVGGVINLFYENFNHKPKVVGGILEEQCKEMLKVFFKELR